VSFASPAWLSDTSAKRASAYATAESSSSSPNGLGKKSTAPRFIAHDSHWCITVAGNKNYLLRPAFLRALPLEGQAVESRQLHVEHQARWAEVRRACQILGGAGEDLDSMSSVARRLARLVRTDRSSSTTKTRDYITERNSKRDRLVDIPFHRPWQPMDAGELTFVGLPVVAQQNLLIASNGTEHLVLPITQEQRQHLAQHQRGIPLTISAGVTIKAHAQGLER
jgi:hypothetical protein